MAKQKSNMTLSPRIVMLIAKKEYRVVMHERTFILSVLIQLFIASFSTFLVIGLTSFYDPTALGELDMGSTKIAVVGNVDNDSELYLLLQNSDLAPILYGEFSDAYTAFYDRRVDAILIIPDEPPGGYEILDIDIYLPRSDLKATLVSLQLKEPLEKFEQSVRDIRTKRISGYTPLDLNIVERKTKTSSTYFEFLYVALLPLLVFTPAFISGGLVVDFITEEFERKTIDLLLVSPISLLDVISGKVLLATIIAPVQALAWVLLLMMNGIVIHNVVTILLLVLVTAMILVLVSGIISVMFKERGMAQLFYSLILIFLFMISYLFTNSPMNLVTRLSIQSIGGLETVIWLGGYSLLAVVLYGGLLKVVEGE
ncbi:MAG: ABC transporter permease [Methanosarcinaceae archaeon]|nr:ABC transporter permease [Methanosarcinaceae archaeon]